jgi:polyisoprenoid-binding protein YceI
MAGSRARRGWLAAVAAVLVLALAGGGYLLLARNSDAPAPVALDAATATTATTATTAGAGAQPAATGTPDGAWRVRDDGSSFVGYRVRERLAQLSSPNEAVGRSTQVTGTMQVAGDQVETVRVEADLRGLQSDEGRRDNAIRQRGLESTRFPTAVFELAEPIRLDQEPAESRRVSGQGKGRLTVRGITREVTADLEGRWDGSTIQVAGSIPVRMSDFQIEPPLIGFVLSIEDALTVEFRLNFVPA